MAGASTAAPVWSLFTNVVGSVVTQFSNPAVGRQIADSIRDAMTADGFNAYVAGSRLIDVRQFLPHVTAPTLVLHDPSFPFGSFDLCREVASGICDAHLIVVNDRSMMGGPHDETLAAIDRFLRLGSDAQNGERSGAVATNDGGSLTRRESEVLRLIATGRSNKAIASGLGVSERTVARHVTNIYAKIGAHTRAAATAYAIRNSLT